MDAGLISVGTKPPPSKQQGHTVAEAVTRCTMQLVQASFPHGSSRGCESTFAHTTHFNSSRTVVLFWPDNGGYGSREKTGGGAIFQRCVATMFGVRPG